MLPLHVTFAHQFTLSVLRDGLGLSAHREASARSASPTDLP